ncbi:MAG: efflux RND transporter permease subunit [Elusimicrobiota bacterium]
MVRFALKAPYTIIVAALITLVVGVFCLLHLPVDILPTFRLPAVMVITTYTGMPAEMLEMDITNRLERWLSQASGLDHIESRSLIGVSILNCFFQPGFDPNNALTQISSLVASDLHYLPPGTLPPIVMSYDPTANLPVAMATVYTPNMGLAHIWDEANYVVRDELNALPGVIAPVVFGGKIREIMTFLNKKALAGYGLSPLDVVNTLSRENEMIPTGDAKMGLYDYSIMSNGMVPTVGDFNKLPIEIVNQQPVFIKDVGQTKDSSAIQTNVVQVNGTEETFIPIFRQLGSNTISVVQGIKNDLPRILSTVAPKSQIKLLFDQSIKVSQAVHDVVRELVLGVLLASIVIYFFLGDLTLTGIACLEIPLSIIGCMIGLYYAGESLNLMTQGRLALAVGPLIDMAVVVLENTERHLESGKHTLEAAEQGANEVSQPLLVATLSLIFVFFPITFFQGLGKYLFMPLALSVSLAVIISYFTAMTVVPLASSKFLKPKDKHGHKKSKAVEVFNHYWMIARGKYEILLDWCLNNPRSTVALSTGAFVLSLTLFPFLGSEFFPVTDQGMFAIRMRTEIGTRIERTSKLAVDVSQDIRSRLPKDSVETVLSNIGVLPSWAAAYSPNSASHDALIDVQMSPKSPIGAKKAIDLLRPKLATLYPGTLFSYSLIDPISSALNYGALSPIDLRVLGPSLHKDQAISRGLLAKVEGVPGVTDAFIEQEIDYPAINIEISRTKAAYLGLSADDVMKNVITALNSSVLFALNFWDDPVTGNNYFIGAQYPEKDIDSRQTIENIAITPSREAAAKIGAVPTLLRNIAALSMQSVPVEISHYDIQRSFDIMANVSGRDIGSIAAQIDKILAKTALPRGYRVQWGGGVAAMRASFGDLGVGMILSLVLIFLLIVAQLKSFLDPLLILATVPMGFIGVLWVLFLTNTTLNVQSLMGVIMLIGIIVSNSVILTDFANERLKSGISPKLAMREGATVRLRPILMTAISTVTALLPSAFSGANAPLARAVIGGLLAATFFTLNFLPALYILAKTPKAS